MWAFISALSSALAWLADRRYRSLPGLAPVEGRTPLPPLSVIIPARDEVDNLRRLLPTLNTLRYPGWIEIIVVDDGSVDGTGRIAHELGARVLRVDRPASGWLGKPYACHQGALSAGGEWLLFTDADTEHLPDGPALAVAHAVGHDLDALSLFLQQEISHPMVRLAMITAFAGLFASLRPQAPPLNGQYVLIRRRVYLSCGGFQAVRGEPLEDLAFGQHLRRHGYQVRTLRGAFAARVHMYSGVGPLWRGLGRLSAGSLRWSGRRGLISVLLIMSTVVPFTPLWLWLRRRLGLHWGLAAWLASVPGFIPWARRFGARWQALLAPLGGLLVAASATWGLIRSLPGFGYPWKGRIVRRGAKQ